MGEQSTGTSRARTHAGCGDDDRTAGPGLRQCGRYGQSPGRSSRPPQPHRHTLIDHQNPDSIVSDGDLTARRGLRSCLTGWSSQTRQAHSCSTTTTTSRWPPAPTSASPKIVHSASRLTAGSIHFGGGRQRSLRNRCSAGCGTGGNRPPLADPGANPYRLRLARAGQLQGTRLTAR